MPARSALQRRRPGPRRCRGGYPAGGRGRDPDAERLRRPARSGAGVRLKIGPGHCLRQTPGALTATSRLARFANSQFQRTAAPRCAAIMACDLSLCRARKWAQLCTQRQGRFRRINPTAAALRRSRMVGSGSTDFRSAVHEPTKCGTKVPFAAAEARASAYDSRAQGRDLCKVSGERQHGTRDRPNLSIAAAVLRAL